jgi:TatD DNase family protein
MTDAHAHIGTDVELIVRLKRGIRTMLCGTEPASAAEVVRLAGQSPLFIPCCALHPWKAAAFRPEDMLPFLDVCPVVGETGLDSVWCDTLPDAQMEALLWNLDYAQRAGKPVVLHTKGMEREIARILRNYSMPKLVHWYSCEEPPTDYLDQDCYFTVGPDAETNAAVKQVIALTPLERLLVETDGLAAVEWALGRIVPSEELPDVLSAGMRVIAVVKRLPLEAVEAALERNFDNLLL